MDPNQLSQQQNYNLQYQQFMLQSGMNPTLMMDPQQQYQMYLQQQYQQQLSLQQQQQQKENQGILESSEDSDSDDEDMENQDINDEQLRNLLQNNINVKQENQDQQQQTGQKISKKSDKKKQQKKQQSSSSGKKKKQLQQQVQGINLKVEQQDNSATISNEQKQKIKEQKKLEKMEKKKKQKEEQMQKKQQEEQEILALLLTDTQKQQEQKKQEDDDKKQQQSEKNQQEQEMKNEEENLILQSLMEEKTIQKQQQKEMKKQLKFDVLVEGEGNKDINQYMKKKGKKEKERNDVPRTILDYKSKAPDQLLELIDGRILKFDSIGINSEKYQKLMIDDIPELKERNFEMQQVYICKFQQLNIGEKNEDNTLKIEFPQNNNNKQQQNNNNSGEQQDMDIENEGKERYSLPQNADKIFKFPSIDQNLVQKCQKSKIKCAYQIRQKAEFNYYQSFEQFLKDYEKLLVYNLYCRCKSAKSYQYMLYLNEKFQKFMQEKQYQSKFLTKKQNDLLLLYKFDLDKKMDVKEYPYIPKQFRQYEVLTDYVVQQGTLESENSVILEKLRSKKQPQICEDQCQCKLDYEDVGDFSLNTLSFESKCKNRCQKLECICAKESGCKNAPAYNHQDKILDQHVKETLCWGIDLYTRKNIFHVLPEDQSIDDRSQYVEHTLTKAANLVGEEGWNILKVIEFIVKNSPSHETQIEMLQDKYPELLVEPEVNQQKEQEQNNKEDKQDINSQNQNNQLQQEKQDKDDNQEQQQKQQQLDQQNEQEDFKKFKIKHQDFQFSYLDRMYSKALKRVVELEVDKEAFRLHSKGMGVICLQKEGIKKNEFITKYVGEIYSPWRWYERQDFTKKQLKQLNQKDSLPDFYNITLEIHKEDPKGYDILFVDPILKGNYSSRFSHSCDPNCGTITTISDGKYMIGMHSMQNIQYGEELCFDYSAVTESRAEHKQAVCLCGTKRCRGKYLALSISSNKDINFLLEQNSCFLKRNSDLLRACFEEFTEEDAQILEDFNLRENVLKNCPNWLKKWMTIILDGIQGEGEQYFEFLLASYYNMGFRQMKNNKNNNIKAIQEENVQQNNNEDDNNIEEEQQQKQINQEQDQLDKNSQQQQEQQQMLSKESQDLTMEIEIENEQKQENNQNQTPDKKQQSQEQEDQDKQTEIKDINNKKNNTGEIKKEQSKQEEDSNDEEIQKKKQLDNDNQKQQNTEIEVEVEEEKKKRVYNKIVLDYEKELLENNPNKQNNIELYKYIAMERIDSRLQNMVITVDKIKYFLTKAKDFEKPLECLKKKDILFCLLGNFKNNEFVSKKEELSIVGEFYELMKQFKQYEQCQKAVKYTEKLYDLTKEYKDNVEIQVLIVRILFLTMSQYFRKMEKSCFHYYGLSVILYMMSFTHTFFTNHEYTNIVSQEMTIKENEIFNMVMMEQKQDKSQKVKQFKESRMYSPQFVWGQLTAWFKQTVANPHASLSQDRRGSLSFPVLNTSFNTSQTAWPFQEKNDKAPRNSFLGHLKSKPKDSWPPDYAKWSFKNSLRFYGTMVFEGIHQKNKMPQFITQVLDLIDLDFSQKWEFFKEKEEKLENIQTEQSQEVYNKIVQIMQELGIQIPENAEIDPSLPLDKSEIEEDEQNKSNQNLTRQKPKIKNSGNNSGTKNRSNLKQKNRKNKEYDSEEDSNKDQNEEIENLMENEMEDSQSQNSEELDLFELEQKYLKKQAFMKQKIRMQQKLLRQEMEKRKKNAQYEKQMSKRGVNSSKQSKRKNRVSDSDTDEEFIIREQPRKQQRSSARIQLQQSLQQQIQAENNHSKDQNNEEEDDDESNSVMNNFL